MDIRNAVTSLQTSGLNLSRKYGLRADTPAWQCAEYLLTMKNDLKQGAFDDFMRKLTPLLTNMFELYLEYKGLNVRKAALNEHGKWDLERMPDEWHRVLDREFSPAFKGGYLAANNMLPLIHAYGDDRAAELAKALRVIEEEVRNTVAHEIVPFG